MSKGSDVSQGREIILDAAIENFERLGYHGTSVRDIARGAGLAAASIYHHFASKQLILQEILEKCLTDVISLTQAAVLRSAGTPEAQLVALVRTWVTFHATRRSEAVIGASEIRSLDETGHRIVVSLRDQQESLFRDVIERGVTEGEFDVPFPREAARAIINMGYSIASWYRPGGELSPDELADRYAVLALSTVQAKSSLHRLGIPSMESTPQAEGIPEPRNAQRCSTDEHSGSDRDG